MPFNYFFYVNSIKFKKINKVKSQTYLHFLNLIQYVIEALTVILNLSLSFFGKEILN